MTDSILPLDSTQFECAVERVGARVAEIPTSIAQATRPLEAPAAFLPFLAHGRGLNWWRDNWSVDRKRAIVDQAFNLARLKGTIAGIEAYVAFVDAEVLSAVTPPADFFLSDDFDADDDLYRAWLAGLPEIRLYTVRPIAPAIGCLSETGFESVVTPACFLGAETGAETFFLDGPPPIVERATIVRAGVETEIWFERKPDPRRGRRGEVVTFAWEAEAGLGFFLDRSFLDGDAFLDGAPKPSHELTVAFGYPEAEGEAWNLVAPSSKVQDVVPEVRAVQDRDPFGFYLDHSFLNSDAFLDQEDADRGTYRSIRVMTSEAEFFRAGSFLDADRLGMPPYTAELTIAALEPAAKGVLFLDNGFLDAGFLDAPSDGAAIERVCEAVIAAKALRDTVLLDFDIPTRRSLKRARSFSDLSLG